MKKIFSAILAGVVLSSLATAVSAHIDATTIGEVPAVPAGSVTIDGFMDEAVWADALTVQINQLNLGSEDGAQGVGEHVFGKSITDPCLGWEKTEQLILDLADKL